MTDILAVVGSVRFACPGGQHLAFHWVRNELRDRRPDAVCSGGADGVDLLGQRAAELWNIPTCIHPPKVRRWGGPGGFMERNLVIARTCTRLLRIVCAESRTYGSGWTADRAHEMGKPVRRIVVARGGTFTDSGWSMPPAQLDLFTTIGGTRK